MCVLGPFGRCHPHAQNDSWHPVGTYSLEASITLTVITARLRRQHWTRERRKYCNRECSLISSIAERIKIFR